ncbi:unnamed protein product [Polarella glacialis]|uniref:Uncharacterized protein n=1 Tax=Polarella glacialis TaxID=89957 RepID=A0A813GM52_POLGL|nr:unnamed protein product [Polarella glacialis]
MRGTTNKSTFKKKRKTKRNQPKRKESKTTNTHGNDDQRRKENKRQRKQPQPNHREPHLTLFKTEFASELKANPGKPNSISRQVENAHGSHKERSKPCLNQTTTERRPQQQQQQP